MGKYRPAIILTLALAVFLSSCDPLTTTPGIKSWVVSTLAGSTRGYKDTGTEQFNNPIGVAVDSSGNLYVADYGNNRIRKITSAGVVSTLAGTGTAGYRNGAGTAAQFNGPSGVAVDSFGNVYVADYHNHRIRKITSTGEVTTIAGSGTAGHHDATGTAAQFHNPSGVAVDSDNNVYVADARNHRIRKITLAGRVTTLAGSGTAGFANGAGITEAQFNRPTDVAVDSSGNLYVADSSNHRIRKITLAGKVSTLAGTGTAGFANGTAARFNYPYGVAVDSSGNLYVADNNNNRIRKITPAGVVSTFAGSIWGHQDAPGTAAQFRYPSGVAVDSSDNVYVADFSNHRIRKITPRGVVSTFAGSGTQGHQEGTGTAAQFNSPYGVAVDSSGNIYVADFDNHRIRKITPRGVVSTFAGSTAGHHDATGTAAQFRYPSGVAVDSSGNIYVADYNNNRIRKITSEGVVTTLAGSTRGYKNATGTEAQFNRPTDVAVDSSGNIYVADTVNHRIRKIESGGKVTTFAGSATPGHQDATGEAAEFDSPTGVAVDSSGNIYVADYNNNRIRKITSEGVVTTLASTGTSGFANGAGTAARFRNPTGVAVDSSGNLYVADRDNNRIQKITPRGVVSTLAGTGTSGFANGADTAAQFYAPTGVAVDSSGNVYVVDNGNNRIRKIEYK